LEGPSGGSQVTPEDSTSGQLGEAEITIGPLLYAGTLEGDSATITPVAEVVDGQLQPLPPGELGDRYAQQILRDQLAPSRKLILFQQSARIGTLTVATSRGIDEEYCTPRPTVVGRVELRPSAQGMTRVLATDETFGQSWTFDPVRTPVLNRTLENAAQNLAGEALNQLRAPWPGALQNIRQDLQVLNLDRNPEPSVVATFLFRDTLGVGPTSDDAYSLLVLGEPAGSRFRRTFTWYRPAETDAKGAPRFFGSMDWDRDGEDEILLEVFGSATRWWAGLERTGESWEATFQDPCGVHAEESPAPENSGGSPQ